MLLVSHPCLFSILSSQMKKLSSSSSSCLRYLYHVAGSELVQRIQQLGAYLIQSKAVSNRGLSSSVLGRPLKLIPTCRNHLDIAIGPYWNIDSWRRVIRIGNKW